jgi:hypothetical protein
MDKKKYLKQSFMFVILYIQKMYNLELDKQIYLHSLYQA